MSISKGVFGALFSMMFFLIYSGSVRAEVDLETIIESCLNEDAEIRANENWPSTPSINVEDGDKYSDVLAEFSQLRVSESAQWRLVFEMEMANCIIGKIIEDREKVLWNGNVATYREQGGVSQLIYAISEISWNKLEAEFNDYIRDRVQGRLCRNGYQIIASRTCSEIMNFEDYGFYLPWSALTNSIKEDATQLATSYVLFENCRDKKPNNSREHVSIQQQNESEQEETIPADSMARCLIDTYSQKFEIYAMAFVTIAARSESFTEFLGYMPKVSELTIKGCPLPVNREYYAEHFYSWLSCLSKAVWEELEDSDDLSEFMETLYEASGWYLLLEQKNYVLLYASMSGEAETSFTYSAIELALTLAEQEDEEGMANVLANYVSPVGSYRSMSRRGGLRVFASLAGEYWLDSAEPDNFAFTSRVGLEMAGPTPLGLNYSSLHENLGFLSCLYDSYCGVQVTLIDLTSAFFLEEEVESVNDYAKSALRPGVGLFHSFGRSPFIAQTQYNFKDEDWSFGIGFRTTVFDLSRF